MDTIVMIYSEVSTIACKRLCQASCGPINAYDSERAIVERATGNPFPDPLTVLQSASLNCPHLNDITGSCAIYQHRPLICRLWGVVDVEGMRCPHGCTPQRWLSDAEGQRLIGRTRDLQEGG